MGSAPPRTPVYPTYTPPAQTSTETYDSYEAEKKKARPATTLKGKGMQLGKKSKTTDMFERVRGELGAEAEIPAAAPAPSAAPAAEPAAARPSTTSDHDAIHIIVKESINANLSREGIVNSLAVSGDLNLRVTDPSLTKIKLNLNAEPTHGAQFRTHPNVDRNLFNSSKIIQMTNATKGFPVNQSVGVLRWRATPKADDTSALPISFTVWVNKDGAGSSTLTVEYELTGGDALDDVSVSIPFSVEPTVSSFDANYEVAGDSLEWTVGSVGESNATGSFEFDAATDDENDFFPMQIRFSKSTPFVSVDVSLCCFGPNKVLQLANSYRSHRSSLPRWARRSRLRARSSRQRRAMSLSNAAQSIVAVLAHVYVSQSFSLSGIPSFQLRYVFDIDDIWNGTEVTNQGR